MEVPPGPGEEVEENFLLFPGKKLLVMASLCERSAGLQSWIALQASRVGKLCRPPELENSASVITKWLLITWGLRVTEAEAAWGPIDLMMPFLVSLGRGWVGLSAWPERQHPLSGSNLWASCCCRRLGVQSWSLPYFALFGQLLNLQGSEITIDWLKDIFEGCWWFSQ